MNPNADKCPSCGESLQAPQDPLAVHLCFFAKHGDREAFAQLLEATQERLQAYAARVCRRHCLSDIAEDAVQKAVLKMIASSQQFDCSRPAWPWMKQIVRHQCFDTGRALRRYREHVQRLSIASADGFDDRSSTQERREPKAPSRYDPPCVAISNEGLRRIAQVLEELPPNQRRMLELRLDEASYEEIAGDLQVPKSVIGGTLNRIRRYLHDRL